MKYLFWVAVLLFCSIHVKAQDEPARDKFTKQLFEDFKNNRLEEVTDHFVDSAFLDKLISLSIQKEEVVTEKYNREVIHKERLGAKEKLKKSLQKAYNVFDKPTLNERFRSVKPTIEIYTKRSVPIESFGVKYSFTLDDLEGEIKIPYILFDTAQQRYVIMSERVRYHLIPKPSVISRNTIDTLYENDEIITEATPAKIPPPPPVNPKDRRARTKQLTQAEIDMMPPSVPKMENRTLSDVFEFPDKLPEFPGGQIALQEFISVNLMYPRIAQESEVEGRVYISFVVNIDGSISDIEIIRDIGAGCGQEAARVVRSMPKWQAGEQNGKKVRSKFTLPIKFVQQ